MPPPAAWHAADEVFTLGVASGEPRPDSVVIWTRLAPKPLQADGGMPAQAVPVRWEVAADARFARVLQACECDARGRLGLEEAAYPQAARLLHAQQAALSVETAPIAQAAAAHGLKGPEIGLQITQARVKAITMASL